MKNIFINIIIFMAHFVYYYIKVDFYFRPINILIGTDFLLTLGCLSTIHCQGNYNSFAF